MAEREIWLNARRFILATVGGLMSDIWLAAVELLAVDPNGLLVLATPDVTSNWVEHSFGRFIAQACEHSGRGIRFASPPERAAMISCVRQRHAAHANT